MNELKVGKRSKDDVLGMLVAQAGEFAISITRTKGLPGPQRWVDGEQAGGGGGGGGGEVGSEVVLDTEDFDEVAF